MEFPPVRRRPLVPARTRRTLVVVGAFALIAVGGQLPAAASAAAASQPLPTYGLEEERAAGHLSPAHDLAQGPDSEAAQPPPSPPAPPPPPASSPLQSPPPRPRPRLRHLRRAAPSATGSRRTTSVRRSRHARPHAGLARRDGRAVAALRREVGRDPVRRCRLVRLLALRRPRRSRASARPEGPRHACVRPALGALVGVRRQHRLRAAERRRVRGLGRRDRRALQGPGLALGSLERAEHPQLLEAPAERRAVHGAASRRVSADQGGGSFGGRARRATSPAGNDGVRIDEVSFLQGVYANRGQGFSTRGAITRTRTRGRPATSTRTAPGTRCTARPRACAA